MDPSIHSSTCNYDEDEEPTTRQGSVRTPGFLLKVLQLLVSVACLSLFLDGRYLIVNNIATVNFPFVVYTSNIIINTVICSSYLFGMKMRELLIRLFLVLDAILYLAAGMVILLAVVVYWPAWTYDIMEYDDVKEWIDDYEMDVPKIPRRRCLLVLLIVLTFSNSIICIVDVACSIRRTIELI